MPDLATVPATVTDETARDLYRLANTIRERIKDIAKTTDGLRTTSGILARGNPVISGEVPANATLAYRALEDASMRLGKVLQALDGGVSVYDKATTVGAPD